MFPFSHLGETHTILEDSRLPLNMVHLILSLRCELFRAETTELPPQEQSETTENLDQRPASVRAAGRSIAPQGYCGYGHGAYRTKCAHSQPVQHICCVIRPGSANSPTDKDHCCLLKGDRPSTFCQSAPSISSLCFP